MAEAPSAAGRDTVAPVPWHALEANTVLDRLETRRDGLSEEEAKRRLARDGPNALPAAERPSWIVRLLRQLADPLVGALLVAAAIAVSVAVVEGSPADPFLARFSDAIAIVVIVALNAALGLLQERRADRALDALRTMTTGTARVQRDGRWRTVPVEELVVGDVLDLEAGDSVPADVRLFESSDLASEEAALTGESMPSKKSVTAVDEGAPVAERRDLLFFSTQVTRGRGRGVVVATGARTEIGRVGALMAEGERPKTPLEVRLERFGRIILVVCVTVAVSLFFIGLGLGRQSWTVLLLTSVSLAVAAIPEGLPAITTITLALGMERMARRGAIVRKLPAVETLGSATIICTDKTGTLTENAMTVRSVVTLHGTVSVTGEGYHPEGALLDEHDQKLEEPPAAVRSLLEVGVVCSTTHMGTNPEGGRQALGDPTEAALLVLAEKANIHRDDVLHGGEVLEQRPFDSERRRMAVIARRGDGRVVSHVKGALDAVLSRCTDVLDDGKVRPLTAEDKALFTKRSEAFAGKALRVLAFAEREDPEGEPEQGLVFLGIVAMLDPPRAGVEGAIRECREAGIRIAMITGDHASTGVAIAKELGMWRDDAIALSAHEIDAVGEPGGPDVNRVAVFARASPAQKLGIVRALQEKGHVVAMTGDGVNDAPALKVADIGVAMGKSGTDVAREAADMVLADDNFATIVEAVREGRSLFRNIQRFIFFLNSVNAGLVVAVLGAFFVPAIPTLTPLMILWINLVTNGMPALALGIEPPDDRHMQGPPRRPEAGIWEPRDAAGILIVGASMGASALALFLLTPLLPGVVEGGSLERARTLAFCLLAVSPLIVSFSCRSATEPLWRLPLFGNRSLWLAVAGSALLQALTVVVPPLRTVFGTHLPTWRETLFFLALALVPLVALETFKAFVRLRERRAVPSLKPRHLSGQTASARRQ